VRRLRRGRTARALAKALSLLLLLPYLTVLGARPASAQVVTVPTVVVLDFTNRTGVGGPLLGRSAASALILEMTGAERWDVVRESVVQDTINRLNLHRPFDKVDLARLASSVQASAIVTGEVIGARVTQNPAQASVTIVVRVTDVASQELINGAVTTGTSSPRVGYTGNTDVLLDEAVSKAAYLARQSLDRYQLPEGTVLNTTVVGTRYDALINIGARQGVKLGMRFVVLRGGDLVGEAQASSVDPDQCVATVQQNFRGVKPEDRVRAIYELAIPRTLNGNAKKRADAGEPVMRVAAYAGEQPGQQPGTPGQTTTPAPTTPPTTEPAEPPVVQSETNETPQPKKHSPNQGLRYAMGALAILGIAALASRKGGTEAFSVKADTVRVGSAPAVRIRWTRPRQVSHEDVVQYQVYRTGGGDFDRFVGKVVGDQREFFDTVHDPADIDEVFTGQPGEMTTSTTTIMMVPGIKPGVTYFYTIVTIFRPKVTLNTGDTGTGTGTGGGTGGTNTTTNGFEISPRSSHSNSVTPTSAPAANSPDGTTPVNFTNVTFTTTSVQGATTYVFQASTDPFFRNNVKQLGRVVQPGAQGGVDLTVGPVNLATLFPGASQVYWRVGSRDDRSSNGGSFVFGNPVLLTRAAAP
jgi:hypothetical protein